VGSGNIFEELLTRFTVKMDYMGSLIILVFIMDILSQKNMPIYEQNVTIDPLGCLCKELPLGFL
jgi:hypothetical protein